jgi:hypothetical protein
MAPLAPPAWLRHIRVMTGRPCRPDADLKRMWRLLLPGTAFPACGVPDEADTSERVALVESSCDDKAHADAGQPQR